MVDVRAFDEDRLAAQIPYIDETDQPYETQDGSSNTITWESLESQEKGEDRRTHIEQGVIESNSALEAIRIASVCESNYNHLNTPNRPTITLTKAPYAAQE